MSEIKVCEGNGEVEAAGKVSGFDSKTRLLNGDLLLENNLWYGFGAGNTIAEFAAGDDQQHTRDYLSDVENGNRVADPMLTGISRTADSKGLDPRPKTGSAALDASAVKAVDGDFFTATTYVGAFAPNNLWIQNWTALDAHGYVSQVAVSNENDRNTSIPTAIKLDQNYPNPFNPTTNISFSLPSTQKVTLKVYDMLGREVATLLNNKQFSAGEASVTFDASSLSSGVYLYRLTGNNLSLLKKMTLIK